MNYEPILSQLDYWTNDPGSGDEYRKTHDRDCILTGGDLRADTIISLWLPLRYTLNHFDVQRWQDWKEKAYKKFNLKTYLPFVEDLKANIEVFLPEDEVTAALIELFEIGKTHCNVMLLPYRWWNSVRGYAPYWDYLPHFLHDLLNTEDALFQNAVTSWIEMQHLTMFFEDGIIDKEHIIDLAGTGNVRSHKPEKINCPTLLRNYIKILKKRDEEIQREMRDGQYLWKL